MKHIFINLSSFICLFCIISLKSFSHDITFCGEEIPITDDFVANKLMNVIRKQIQYVNLPQLRQQANRYFNTVEDLLRRTGLPEDLKYVAIVESGFRNVTSPVGAAGFWQLMPNTALEYGLKIDNPDERNDIFKSTYVAFQVFAQYYKSIRKNYGISSWILTAAAYNVGIGSISNSIGKQGKTNYFQLHLNAETAEYVYKIIAVKELWEHPELYMKNFGYNIFSSKYSSQSKKLLQQNEAPTTSDFTSVTVDIHEKDGIHPDKIELSNVKDKLNGTESSLPKKNDESKKGNFIWAKIKGDYKEFEDGKVISIELVNDLQLDNLFSRRGNIIRGIGWLIDDRIFIDLGHGRDMILYDTSIKQGLALNSLKNNEPILLKIYKTI